MVFNNDKKNLPEDISGQRIELSLDDLNQVTVLVENRPFM